MFRVIKSKGELSLLETAGLACTVIYLSAYGGPTCEREVEMEPKTPHVA
jgi:hypothetical protein